MTSILNRVIATTGLALLSATALAQPVTLKVAHFLPSSSNAHQTIIAPWCAKVEKESGGELKCQIYPAMQLGGTPPQLMDQARLDLVGPRHRFGNLGMRQRGDERRVEVRLTPSGKRCLECAGRLHRDELQVEASRFFVPGFGHDA